MHLDPDYTEMLLRLVVAVGAGACIGYERSFHGRPAGLRTHVLVCLASSVLMLVTVYEDHWVRIAADARIDATRMAQGIMTGIGFLGAGVIVKEGLNIRGLTTAASIWITAAIGVLAGTGMYATLVSAVILTLLVLAVFRRIEQHVPTQVYYDLVVKYAHGSDVTEDTLRDLFGKLGFEVAHFTYRVEGAARSRSHELTLHTTDHHAAPRLAHWLEQHPAVLEFCLAPTGS